MLAAENGNAELCTRLVEHGANIDLAEKVSERSHIVDHAAGFVMFLSSCELGSHRASISR